MTYDTIERPLNAKIEILKESLEEIVNMGDLSDLNGLEIEFVYPDEKNEYQFKSGKNYEKICNCHQRILTGKPQDDFTIR